MGRDGYGDGSGRPRRRPDPVTPVWHIKLWRDLKSRRLVDSSLRYAGLLSLVRMTHWLLAGHAAPIHLPSPE
jgi:hypothetical protein